MQTQQFTPSAAMVVTPLGLGLAALGRPGYINLGHAEDLSGGRDVQSMEQHAHTVLDAAYEAGIRYFDAARSYGKAEDFLASWLATRELALGAVSIGSKWGYTYTADWQIKAEVHEVKEHSLEVLLRQRKESADNLGDYLGLYQVHSATESSGILTNTDVHEQLAQYRDEGLIIGLSLSGPGQASTLLKALEIEVGGKPLFRAVQATWNLLEKSAGDALRQAHEAGMGVIVKEALANGRLTPRNDRPQFTEQMQVLNQVANEKETTIDALALAAVVAQPWCSVALSGAASVAHVLSNVKALDVDFDQETASRLDGLVEQPEAYWQTRSSLAWN